MKFITAILFFLTSIVGFSQESDDKNPWSISDVSVTSLMYDLDSLEELKDFNYEDMEAAFKDSDPNSDISIGFSYSPKEASKTSTEPVDEFKFVTTGKAADISKLSDRMKKAAEAFVAGQ